MTQAGESTVASIAAAVREGSMSVDEACAALANIEPTSNIKAPASSVDEAYRAEVEADVVQPSDENNPNRLYFGGKVSIEDFKRMHDALTLRPGELRVVDPDDEDLDTEEA